MAPFLLRSGLPTCLFRSSPRLRIRTMRITSLFPRPPRVRLAIAHCTAHLFDRPSRIGPMMTMMIAKFWNLSMLFQFPMLLRHIRTFIQRLQPLGSAPDTVLQMPRLLRPRRPQRPKPSVPGRSPPRRDKRFRPARKYCRPLQRKITPRLFFAPLK